MLHYPWIRWRSIATFCNQRDAPCLVAPASPLSSVLSKAVTVVAYTSGLKCGRMLALPTWLQIICAYSVAALVPTLLPNAHGDNCRVFTTISASALAATLASPAAAVGVSFVLCLCPTRMLWWPTDEETDTVTSLLREVLKWMDAHDDVLPARHNRPTPQQKEENSLRVKYMHYKQRAINLTDAQRALQEEIDRRATNQKDLGNRGCTLVRQEVIVAARWSAENSHLCLFEIIWQGNSTIHYLGPMVSHSMHHRCKVGVFLQLRCCSRWMCLGVSGRVLIERINLLAKHRYPEVREWVNRFVQSGMIWQLFPMNRARRQNLRCLRLAYDASTGIPKGMRQAYFDRCRRKQHLLGWVYQDGILRLNL